MTDWTSIPLARRRFDRVEILGRLRSVEEGGTTRFERELAARLQAAEQALRRRDETLRAIQRAIRTGLQSPAVARNPGATWRPTLAEWDEWISRALEGAAE